MSELHIDSIRWPREAEPAAVLIDVSAAEVIEALIETADGLRVVHRVGRDLRHVFAPTLAMRLIVVIIARSDAVERFVIIRSRQMNVAETDFWRRNT